jgi:hypothetical protein
MADLPFVFFGLPVPAGHCRAVRLRKNKKNVTIRP